MKGVVNVCKEWRANLGRCLTIAQALSAKACQGLNACFCRSWPCTEPEQWRDSALRLPPTLLPSYFQRVQLGGQDQRGCISQVPGYQAAAMHSSNTTSKSGCLEKTQGNQEEATWASPQLPRAPFFAEGSSPYEARAPRNIIPRAFPCQGAHYKGAMWGRSDRSLQPSPLQCTWER